MDNSQSQSLAIAEATRKHEFAPMTNSASMILQGDALHRLEKFATMMAKGSVTVPRHLQGNVGDCLAITMQAAQWGMNPFAVAQKTHVSQGGALGYEAQLISAIITSSGAVDGDPEYEFLGNWDKILGKVEERKSEKGGKYYVPTYTREDEEGLGVVCQLRLRGQSDPRELRVMMSQCFPRFSTQWATDPKQQICYVAIRKWARLHKPGVILGVYADDELEAAPAKDMGMVEVVDAANPAKPEPWPEGLFAQRLPAWRDAVAAGKATADAVVAKARTKYPLTEAQEAAIRAPQAAAPATEPEIVMTFAQVADRMNKADSMDKLAEAASLIGAVRDDKQRAELSNLYERRGGELIS